MLDKNQLLQSLAGRIADYRAGEIPRRDEAKIDRWLSQFPKQIQMPVLAELDHVLEKSYVSKAAMENFLDRLLTSKKLAGDDPKSFWQSTNFLDIQQQGNSQRDMLSLLDKLLSRKLSLKIADCVDIKSRRYIYIDDFLYSGGRIRSDIKRWIEKSAPADGELHIITIGQHTSGWWYAQKQISDHVKATGKKIAVSWWRLYDIEDRKSETNACDVLRPTQIPAVPELKHYLEGKVGEADLRKPGNAGPFGLYTGDDGKILLEQNFLSTGFEVLQKCAYLRQKDQMRPLGSSFFGAGFGSPFVTYRNCANNTPLVFWAGDPWYPLFPRKTN